MHFEDIFINESSGGARFIDLFLIIHLFSNNIFILFIYSFLYMLWLTKSTFNLLSISVQMYFGPMLEMIKVIKLEKQSNFRQGIILGWFIKARIRTLWKNCFCFWGLFLIIKRWSNFKFNFEQLLHKLMRYGKMVKQWKQKRQVQKRNFWKGSF